MANFFDQFDAPAANTAPASASTQPAPASNYFDQYDPPQSASAPANTSVAADVAQAVPAGAAKGAIGLVGMQGDAASLGKRIAELVLTPFIGADAAKAHTAQLEKSGAFNSVLQDIVGDKDSGFQPNGPTSSQVRSEVEKATGPLYDAQTTPGKFAETAASFVPGAVALGTGAPVSDALKLGVAPGVASEAAGQATKGTDFEPWARGVGAVAGGVGGALASAPSTAERVLGAGLPKGITQQTIDQAQSLINDAASRGVSLTWPEALSQVAGKPVLSDTMRLVESAPQTREQMSQFYGQRPAQIDAAAAREFGIVSPPTSAPSTIGPAAGAAAEGTINDVRGAINNATAPFYKSAEQAYLSPADMAKVEAIPGYKEAAAAVRADPQLNRYVSGLPDNSVGFLNEVKKYLDAQGENAASPVQQGRNMQRAAGFGQSAAAVAKAGTDNSLDYATALALQADARQRYLDPLLQGPLGKIASKDTTTQQAIEAVFPARPLANSEQEVSTAISALAKRNPWAAQQLVRAHLQQKLDDAFNAAGRGQDAAQFAGASFANRVAGSSVVDTQRFKNLQSAVEALPNGQQTWQGFQRFLDIAQATGTRMPIGSRTAFNEKDLLALSTGNVAANLVKEAASPERWLNMAHDYVGRWQLGRNLDSLAALLTDPKAGATLKQIATQPAASRQGAMLAARLAAQISALDTSQKPGNDGQQPRQ